MNDISTIPTRLYESFLLTFHVLCFFLLFHSRVIIVAVDVAVIDYDKSVHSIELLWLYKLVYLGIVCGECI